MSVKPLTRVVSGIQPSGILHLGNYLGAVKNWVQMQDENDKKCFFFIADHHSATLKFLEDLNKDEIIDSPIEKNNLNTIEKLTIQTAACLLATGVNPKKVTIFTQSNILPHSELMWILSCMSPLSWLNKMIQYKEKSKSKDFCSTGLYTYPILMAADILIYKGELVPVGEDQIQHLEITRDIAMRLNKIAKSNVVPSPEYIVNKNSSRVMSLQNGLTKMSKSDKNTHSCLSLIITEEEIKSKITKAKTDSLGKITYDPKQRPEISNLINIYSQIENISVENTVNMFSQCSTFEFKQELIKSLNDFLLPISYKATNLIEKEFDYIRDVLREGKKVANEEASKTLSEVKQSLKYFL
jgi:tryptophanyl-tRNA synthetase